MYYLAALFISILTSICNFGVLAQTSGSTTLSYDTTYDNADLSLNDVACSDGANGLETKNPSYTTLGSLPTFPNVGGVYTVSGWNSTECGSCYAVTYGGNTINILAVDKSTTGFTVSEAAMNSLTNNQAIQDGRVDVTYTQVAASACGLNN